MRAQAELLVLFASFLIALSNHKGFRFSASRLHQVLDNPKGKTLKSAPLFVRQNLQLFPEREAIGMQVGIFTAQGNDTATSGCKQESFSPPFRLCLMSRATWVAPIQNPFHSSN